MSWNMLLLSGGMDSTALAWDIRPELALTIDYGQLSAGGEVRVASGVCAALNIGHRSLRIDCRALGSGDLAGEMPHSAAPVPEWWPFRNQLLITLAAAVALQEGFTKLTFGSVSTDKSHADGRLEFFEEMGRLLRLQEGGLDVEIPGINETSVSLCRRVGIPFEVLAWSHSCHVSDYACGRCRGCLKHRETMRELGYGEY